MRRYALIACGIVVFAAAFQVDAADISYGHPRELKKVESVYVWQTDPPAMKEAIIAELQKSVPALQIAEQEDGAGVILVVRRRASEGADANLAWVTTAMVMRSLNAQRSRILMEPVSHEADEQAALREVVHAFVAELQRANGEKYGKAPPGRYEDIPGPRFRSTAGLRTGMTKNQVRDAVGKPTRIDGKGGRTQIWWFETTDGATRVVFGGDAIVTTQYIPKE